jgi:hypothetical protein
VSTPLSLSIWKITIGTPWKKVHAVLVEARVGLEVVHRRHALRLEPPPRLLEIIHTQLDRAESAVPPTAERRWPARVEQLREHQPLSLMATRILMSDTSTIVKVIRKTSL